MPRPNKPINPGRLDAPSRSSRSHSWTKYGSPGGAGSFSSDPADVEITVEDITVIQSEPGDSGSKWQTRTTAAHLDFEGDYVETPVFETEKQWTVVRNITDRTYTRSDDAVFVEIKPEVDPL